MVTLSRSRDRVYFALKSDAYRPRFRRRRGKMFLNGDATALATPVPKFPDRLNSLILQQLPGLARELLSICGVLRRLWVERTSVPDISVDINEIERFSQVRTPARMENHAPYYFAGVRCGSCGPDRRSVERLWWRGWWRFGQCQCQSSELGHQRRADYLRFAELER